MESLPSFHSVVSSLLLSFHLVIRSFKFIIIIIIFLFTYSLFFFLVTDCKAAFDRFLYILTEVCSVCTYIYIHFFTQMENIIYIFLKWFPKGHPANRRWSWNLQPGKPTTQACALPIMLTYYEWKWKKVISYMWLL